MKLSRLAGGDQFTYTFDMGDDWTHLCTVAAERVDPLQTLGIIPDDPLAFWGWGQIPDQYGRLSEDDEQPPGPDPDMQDLPPIHPYWGPREPAATMAATSLPALDVAAARHFCEQRIPPRALHQVRLELEESPGAITIVERRAPWREDFGPDWTRGPIAQIRYSDERGLWTLYCRDRHQRWNLYTRLAPTDRHHRSARRDRPRPHAHLLGLTRRDPRSPPPFSTAARVARTRGIAASAGTGMTRTRHVALGIGERVERRDPSDSAVGRTPWPCLGSGLLSGTPGCGPLVRRFERVRRAGWGRTRLAGILSETPLPLV